MPVRSLAPLLVLFALAAPASARAFGLSPRLGAAMVVEDGPPGTDASAYGTALSLGLGAGYTWLSVVGDLSFRDAEVGSAALEGGWTEYATKDTVFTLGVRSQLTLLDLFRVAGELHLGESWADHRAAAIAPVDRLGSPDRYAVWGGAAEASYLLTKRLSIGARLGADRFFPLSVDKERAGHEFRTDFDRTSYTAGLLLGLGL